jgi:hypothetical protein
MSGENLLRKFDDSVKRFTKEFDDIVDEERVKMKAEFGVYEAEKLRINSIQVKDDDIIKLNVGGTKITTKRSTLCQVKGSLLASMFSGRWEDSLARDEDDRVFFDFNPQYFLLILEYLRGKTIATLESPPPLPKVPRDQKKSFYNLVEYLGLGSEIVPEPPDKFAQHSTGVTLQEGGLVAVKDSTPSHKYVLGADVYEQGIVRRKLKIESYENNHWMWVGVVKGIVVPQNDNSYQWLGSYGWSLRNGWAWENGSGATESTPKYSMAIPIYGLLITKQGDTVELVVDCDASKLSLHLPSGHQFHIDLPKSQTWRLHVNLSGKNDKIRIMEA